MKKIISGVLVFAMLVLGSVSIFANEALDTAKTELQAARTTALKQKAEKLGITVDQLKAKTAANLEAKKADAVAKGIDFATYKAQLKAEREAKIAARTTALTQKAEKLGITVDQLKAKTSANLEAKKADAAAKGIDFATYKAQLKAETEAKLTERIAKIKAQTEKILAKLSATKTTPVQ